MTFADRLRELRENAGLTQMQLADASGLPLGSIRNYEQGQREPYWQVVFKLADALGVSSEAFKDCIDTDAPADARPSASTKRPAAGRGEKPPAKKDGRKK